MDVTTTNTIARRTAQTRCPGCGGEVDHEHEVGRAARRRAYCSETCRRRSQRARSFAKRHGDVFPGVLGGDTAEGTKAASKPLKLNGRNRHIASSIPPHLWAQIVETEIVDRHRWHQVVSSGGVKCDVTRIRPRALTGASS